MLASRGEDALQRSALLHSLYARTFSPVSQPIVDLARGGIVGFELLTRFDDGAAPERHFAGRTGCRPIAEGIETEPELTALRELGVAFGQGFLLGPPAPVQVPVR